MKASPDTLITIIVSICMATISGALSLVWWVSGLQGRVKTNETDIERIKEIQDKEVSKVNKMDKDAAVMKNDLQTILKVLTEIKDLINERNFKK